MTFDDFFPVWIDYKHRDCKETSLCNYRTCYRTRIAPVFGRSETLTEEEVQRFIDRMDEEGMSVHTIKDTACLLLQMYVAMAKRGHVVPARFDIRYPRERNRRELYTFAEKDMEKLRNYLTDNFTFTNLGILIMMYTGMRIGECCALQWKDIDYGRGVISVSKTVSRLYDADMKKTKVMIGSTKTQCSQREVPVHRILMQILKKLRGVVNPDFFIISNSGKPADPRSFRIAYGNRLRLLGIPYLHPHCMRHTFATKLIRSKADVKTVSAILGHSSVVTTLNTYCHPDNRQKLDSITKAFKW